MPNDTPDCVYLAIDINPQSTLREVLAKCQPTIDTEAGLYTFHHVAVQSVVEDVDWCWAVYWSQEKLNRDDNTIEGK